MLTYSITVSGKVQGVFYRQSTRELAGRIGLTGNVKNLPNGDVLIIATGTYEQLKELTDWCWQGPRKAKVTQVIITEIPLQHFTLFNIEQ